MTLAIWRTVRGRLLILALCVEAVILALMVGNGVRVLYESMADQGQRSANQLLPVLSAALAEPMAQEDFARVQAIVDQSGRGEGFDLLAVIASDGRIVASSGEQANSDDAPRSDIAQPIRHAGRDLGQLRFRLNTDPIAAARRNLFAQGLLIAAAAIVWSGGVLGLTGFWLTRRLARLTAMSEAVARGQYPVSAMKEGDDDIGRLEGAFNAMSRAVRQRVDELTVAIAERRDSESRFRDIAQAASDWIWETDAEYRFTFVSRRVVSILETAKSIVGQSYFDLGLDQSPERAAAHREVIAARRLFRDEIFPIHRQDDTVWVRISGVPVFAADGRFIGYRGVGSNITELMRRERDLTNLHRRNELILDSVGEGIIGLDTRGQVTFANRVAGDLLDYTPADLSHRDLPALVLIGQDESPLRPPYHQGGLHDVKDATFRRRDGELLPVDYYIAPMVDGDQVSGAVMVFRDARPRLDFARLEERSKRELELQVAERTAELRQEIAVRAEAEAALQASRQRLKSITDSLFEGVVVVSRDGRVLFINPSALQLLGCDRCEDLLLDDLFRLRIGNRAVTFAASPWQNALDTATVIRDDDAIFATAQGRALSVAYACATFQDQTGCGAIISFRDIDAFKRAQRDALQASRLASVGQLAAGIAHEINTPIQYIGDNLRYMDGVLEEVSAVMRSARALADAATGRPDLDGPVAGFEAAWAAAKPDFLFDDLPSAVHESLDGVEQIARIVLSMKEFSHPGTSAKVMVDINHALDSTITVSRNVWKHVAQVEKDFGSLVPVLCHAGELNQVFLNLIVNAAHAIEGSGKPVPGRITIVTRHVGGHVMISVADTGTGVPESIRDRIFDPFFTTKEIGKGTGQGLAICRDVVVSKHGGSLEVGGADGEGAVFVVRLPIDAEDEGGRASETEEQTW